MYMGAFMKQYLILLLLPFFVLASCSKKSDDAAPATGVNNGLVTTANGTYAMAGSVLIYSSCGTTTATITVSNYTGYSMGTTISSVQVATGGTFNVPVAPGTYVLSATAGSCSPTPVYGQALTNGQTAYRVCLSTGSECPRSKATETGGTIAIPSTGNGELNFDVANIYLSSKKAATFNLNLNFTNGNNLLNAVPSITQGWSGSVGADGSLKLGNFGSDHLSYSAQVDASLLQFEEGFCELKATASARSADYLKQSGFSAKAVTDFQAAFAQASTAERVCVYPQTNTVDRVVTYKTDDKLSSNRVWFVVLEDNQQAAVKKALPGKLASLVSRPKTDGFAALKKNSAKRQIASENDLLAEEWALGFIVVK
jgi:PKD repeat protein